MTTKSDAKPVGTHVAIDIAKRSHAVLMELPDGRQQRFRMASSADEHDRLVALLRASPQPVLVAMEPRGDYHRTLGHRLLSEGFKVCSFRRLQGRGIARPCLIPGIKTTQRMRW